MSLAISISLFFTAFRVKLYSLLRSLQCIHYGNEQILSVFRRYQHKLQYGHSGHRRRKGEEKVTRVEYK
jgi:hypothetical protein